MRTTALLTLLTALTATAQAANCTTDEQNSITELYASVTSSDACADLTSNAAATSLDYCNDTDCLEQLANLVSELPDCEDDGINKLQGLEAIIDYCGNVTATLEASASGSTSDAAGDDDTTSGSGSDNAAPASGASATVLLLVPTLLAVALTERMAQ